MPDCRSCGREYQGALCFQCIQWAGEPIAQAIHYNTPLPLDFHLSACQKAEQTQRREA